MKYKISQHLLILYSLTEPSDSISYSLNFYCNSAATSLNSSTDRFRIPCTCAMQIP